MNITVYLVILAAAFCTTDATFFGFGKKGKKGGGIFGSYLTDLGEAVLRYAPDFYDAIPKVTKFFGGGGHKKHKHGDDYGSDAGHKKHHNKGYYPVSSGYYGVPSPYAYGSYGSPHFDYTDFHTDYGFNHIYPNFHSFDHGYDHFHGINHLDFW